jgi:hypothetical protein
VLVHVGIDAALGVSDQPAELVGHGPLEPDLLRALLLAAPRLRRVVVDEKGVPVHVDDQVVVPRRGDPESLRQALLHLAGLSPRAALHPQHPHDHPSADPPNPLGPQSAEAGSGLSRARLQPLSPTGVPPADAARFVAAAVSGSRSPRGGTGAPDLVAPDGVAPSPVASDPLATSEAGAHPIGALGAYRPSRRLRRLIGVRAARCEWPGCGARAVRCDAEHDLAWPQGPTCGCNLGPCCRRHHRVKQLGWTKTRSQGSAVRWTSPGRGRSWLSPAQHEPPAPAVRPLPPPSAHDPLRELSPLQQDEELWWLADRPDDPAEPELRATDTVTDPAEDRDLLREHLTRGDTRWTLDLDDPYLWWEPLPTASP